MFSQTSLRTALAAAAVLLSGQSLCGQTADLNSFRERVKETQGKTFGDASCQRAPECIQPQIDQLKATMRDYTLKRLNESHGDTDALVRELLAVDDAWVYDEIERSSGVKRDRIPNRGPFVFRRKTPLGNLIVVVNAFAMWALALPKDAVIIQGFREEGGQYVFAGDAGDSLFGISYEYHPAQMLESPLSNELWFILGGQVTWFMGHLDRIRAYAFDGYKFRELWAPEDREQMEVTISRNELRATFLGPKIPPPTGSRGWTRQDHLEERYRFITDRIVRTAQFNHGDIDPRQRPEK